MNKIQGYTREQLEKKETLKMINEKAENAFFYDNGLSSDETSEIIRIRLKLEKGLKAYGPLISPENFSEYRKLLIKLKFFALADYDEKEIIGLFRDYFLYVFREGKIDIRNKIRVKLFSMPDYNMRDPFLKDIKKALKENKEFLGKENVDINLNGKMVKPYLKNWLSIYDHMVGVERYGKFEISNFIFKNQDAKKLNQAERVLLKKILEFYEQLKLDMTYPDALSAYSLPFYGIKSVGRGLDKKYLPLDPEEYKKEIENREKTREKKKKIIRGEMREDNNLLGMKENLLQRNKKDASKMRSKPKSDYDLIKEKKFANLNPIPKISLAKLSSATSLQKLTVDDFRSYGKDAQSRGSYISTKIKKLIENSPENKEAIKHYLRKSELYRVYLSQGKESLDSKKDMEEIVHNRKNKGEKYLEKEEFEVLKAILKSI